MIAISFVLRVAATAAAAFVSSLVLPAVAANAAEIKVLSSVALTSALDELAPVFEHSLEISLSSATALPPNLDSVSSAVKQQTSSF